jgi:methylmalonyl-CoA/ethylmalonyl-CoA epimerase
MYEDWTFDHVGLVVKDIEKTFEYYQGMDMEVEKPPTTIDQKYKVAYLRKADLSLQFVQSLDANSRQTEFLQGHGEGIDHMCYIVSDLEKEKTKMAGLGIPVVKNNPEPEKDPLYDSALFDTRQGGISMLELRQLRSTADKSSILKETPARNWQFDHLAFVVNDIYKSLIFYMSLGFEVQLRARVKKGIPLAVFCRKGPVTLMFHGHNDWGQGKQFFNVHGEGVDHIAFNVNNIEEEAAKVSRMGFPLKGKIGSSPDAFRAFFETRKYGGVLLELAQVKMSLWW